jgi:PmbA protein
VIARVLEAVAGHVHAADAVVKTDDLMSLAISADGETRVTGSRSQSAHLRVMREGRVGYASESNEALIGGLVGRAMTSAASGEELELFLPAPAPMAQVATRTPQAAAAGVGELEALARALLERLMRDSRRVEVWAERSTGAVQVGNSRGLMAAYDVTLAGAGAVIESIGVGSAPPCRVTVSGAALPSLADLERLVDEVERRLAAPIAPWPGGLPRRIPVCLAPRAVATILRPLRSALTGRSIRGTPGLRDRIGDTVFDPRLTLADDPLAEHRPGSRPLDDDGVVSRRLPLIERGTVLGVLRDLASGARAGSPSTGHGWRTPHAASRVGMTNLRMLPGMENRATLLTMMGRGVLIEDLDWGSGPNPVSGTIALRAPWAYLVEGGNVQGRLEGAMLAGNVFEALREIGGVGNDPAWIGAACVPSLLLGAMSVRREN